LAVFVHLMKELPATLAIHPFNFGVPARRNAGRPASNT